MAALQTVWPRLQTLRRIVPKGLRPRRKLQSAQGCHLLLLTQSWRRRCPVSALVRLTSVPPPLGSITALVQSHDAAQFFEPANHFEPQRFHPLSVAASLSEKPDPQEWPRAVAARARRHVLAANRVITPAECKHHLDNLSRQGCTCIGAGRKHPLSCLVSSLKTKSLIFFLQKPTFTWVTSCVLSSRVMLSASFIYLFY